MKVRLALEQMVDRIEPVLIVTADVTVELTVMLMELLAGVGFETGQRLSVVISQVTTLAPKGSKKFAV